MGSPAISRRSRAFGSHPGTSRVGQGGRKLAGAQPVTVRVVQRGARTSPEIPEGFRSLPGDFLGEQNGPQAFTLKVHPRHVPWAEDNVRSQAAGTRSWHASGCCLELGERLAEKDKRLLMPTRMQRMWLPFQVGPAAVEDNLTQLGPNSLWVVRARAEPKQPRPDLGQFQIATTGVGATPTDGRRVEPVTPGRFSPFVLVPRRAFLRAFVGGAVPVRPKCRFTYVHSEGRSVVLGLRFVASPCPGKKPWHERSCGLSSSP